MNLRYASHMGSDRSGSDAIFRRAADFNFSSKLQT